MVRQGLQGEKISQQLGVDRRSTTRAVGRPLERAAVLLLASPPKTYHTFRPFMDGRIHTIEDLRALMARSDYQGYTWRQLRLLWGFDPKMSDRLAQYNVLQALYATSTKFGKLAAAGFDALIETWIPAIEAVQADIKRRAALVLTAQPTGT